MGPLAFAVWWFASDAGAYETDQLTARERPLADSVEAANDEMDRMLDAAVARINEATGCRADDERTAKVTARIVHHETSSRVWVWERGFWRAAGFGAYSAWMETAPGLDRRAFTDREDVYGDMTLGQALILHVAGPCSTFRVAGVDMGSDKPDHFLGEGFTYLRRSRHGEDPERAVAWGTRTENRIYGLATSRAFSYGDLAANYDGYEFYEGLLEPGSVLVRGEDGCVRRARDWDWAEWVDWRYDEVLVPSVYAPRVQDALTATLARRADEYCAALATWAPSGWEAVRQAHALDPDALWIGPGAPAVGDPFDLDALCAGGDGDRLAAP